MMTFLINSIPVSLLLILISNNTLGISSVFAVVEQQDKVSTGDIFATSIATSVTQNLLTVVSFLIGTSSFILGLSIQNISKVEPNPIINKYFNVLILALAVPLVIIIAYGIGLVGSTLEPGDVHYLLLLFSLFVPAGVILFLVGKVHASSSKPKEV
jgi:hypothetical protein